MSGSSVWDYYATFGSIGSQCNTAARDIKRRLEVIITKMEDLNKLGVPCAFVHVSYWSGGLYVTGDPKLRDSLKVKQKRYMDELNSCDENQEDAETAHDSNISFPSLPAPLQELAGEPWNASCARSQKISK